MKGIKNLACCVIDEFQECKEEAFDRLCGTIRDKGLNLKVICCINPTSEQSWQFKRYFKDLPSQDFTGVIDNKCYIYSSYLENSEFLSDAYLKEIENIKKDDPIRYENQFLGRWLKHTYNALWTKSLIEHAHEDFEIPSDYDYIVIGIDPAISAKKDSDTTAISVCGYKDEVYYVIECVDGIWTPLEWANKAY